MSIKLPVYSGQRAVFRVLRSRLVTNRMSQKCLLGSIFFNSISNPYGEKEWAFSTFVDSNKGRTAEGLNMLKSRA